MHYFATVWRGRTTASEVMLVAGAILCDFGVVLCLAESGLSQVEFSWQVSSFLNLSNQFFCTVALELATESAPFW